MTLPRRHILRLKRRERGIAAVEFALIFPVLLFTFLAIADVAILMISRHELTRLALSATRHCVAQAAPPYNTDGAVRSCATNYAATLRDISGLSMGCKNTLTMAVQTERPSQQVNPLGPSIMAVRLTLKCTHKFLTTKAVPLLGGSSAGQMDLTGQATMPYLNKSAN